MVSVIAANKSEPVVGLTAQNFRARFRGQPVRILSAERDGGPSRVIVLLDTSGSMNGAPSKFLTAQKVALALVFRAPTSSAVAFMTFSSKVTERMLFDRSREEVAQLVKVLGEKDHPAGEGKTALRDAIAEALRLLSAPNPRDVIYVVSDGGDNASRTNESKLKKALLSSGVRVYGILLSDLEPPTEEEEKPREELIHFAEATGGWMLLDEDKGFSDEEQKRAESLARSLWARVSESYRLEMVLPEAPDKPRSWDLALIDLPKHKGSVHLYYPGDLMPCSEATAKK